MSEEWETLVKEKLQQMQQPTVTCLEEWDVCCVDGTRQQIFVASGEQT